ncbi:hypothetical protein [Sphingomonas bacterium]|uniref:hypothetical protein n=1 Tax=Sphingomonas bacterium TaxID=1895847 RepID=UPI0015754748|nr:hypothetical protein [Sphingomonas bacterium]
MDGPDPPDSWALDDWAPAGWAGEDDAAAIASDTDIVLNASQTDMRPPSTISAVTIFPGFGWLAAVLLDKDSRRPIIKAAPAQEPDRLVLIDE